MTAPPLVAVLLGTDHHPFDRLVTWTAEVRRATGADVFVQHGATRLPADLPGAPMLGSAELSALLERAAVVVTHGGPGLIMEARVAGHVPVVVPRDPRLGEHVDDHQLRFVAHIAGSGLVAAAPQLATFRRAVALALGAGALGSSAPSPASSSAAGPGTSPLPTSPLATAAAEPAAERFARFIDDLVRRA
ncbi:glycosyltransferase [Nocardioides abyssi]|uniref:Glycosyltransferase n=1 Tax=Nocardioides abyssi TaxID=3058370 RepID=A0ABT8EUY3_9ACTN|nr:glycosyltransferase [Nocardioides abyssi]MDN4161706.1 glycosyltransferase [Nocardioides abyssi]